MSKTPAIIVDVDGTLALRSPDRGPFDWTKVHLDTPNTPIIWLVRRLAESFHVIVMSGREDTCRAATLTWLHEHEVPFNALLMRRAGDHRRDAVVKRELYEWSVAPHANVEYVIDDRNQVVAMWRELGLTCLQVANGDF